MATQLTPNSYDLPAIEGWAASDSRQLLFVVTQDGTPKDLTNDSVEWELLERPYHDSADAVLTGDSAGVEIQTDQLVDPTAGEFRVDIAESTLAGEWGEYTQRVVVDPPGDNRQSWRGDVTLEDSGGQ